MSELEGVNREQLPLATAVQMQLANGRLQTSRRSCSWDPVTYLWVPFQQMLQVLKMCGDPTRRWGRYHTFHTSVFILLSVSIFCWLLSGDDNVWLKVVCFVSLEKWGWNQDILSKATAEDAGIVVGFAWLRCSHEPRRPTPRNPPPLTTAATNSDW